MKTAHGYILQQFHYAFRINLGKTCLAAGITGDAGTSMAEAAFPESKLEMALPWHQFQVEPLELTESRLVDRASWPRHTAGTSCQAGRKTAACREGSMPRAHVRSGLRTPSVEKHQSLPFQTTRQHMDMDRTGKNHMLFGDLRASSHMCTFCGSPSSHGFGYGVQHYIIENKRKFGSGGGT